MPNTEESKGCERDEVQFLGRVQPPAEPRQFCLCLELKEDGLGPGGARVEVLESRIRSFISSSSEKQAFKVLLVQPGRPFLTGLWAGDVSDVRGPPSCKSEPLKDGDDPTDLPKWTSGKKTPARKLAVNSPLTSHESQADVVPGACLDEDVSPVSWLHRPCS